MSISGLPHHRRKPNIPKTLFVPLFLFILTFIIFFLKYNDWLIKKNIIYPIPPTEVCGLPVQSGPMIRVGDYKTYVIGSYVEHRSPVKTIRTVAIGPQKQEAQYSCLLCCEGRNISVPADYSIHTDHFGFDYGTADITCQVPEHCKAPEHVAITSRSFQNIQSFQHVRNQEEKKDNFAYDFTVCISVMYDYTNVLELVEVLEMFKILGVQKVVIYKTSCDSDTQKILDYYVNQNFVEIIPWSVQKYITVSRGWQKSVSPGELHYFGQIPALNDCLYRYMYQSRYIALQDLDELILPVQKDKNNWTELIPQLEKMYSKNTGFEFENNFFPLSFSYDERPEYQPDSWDQVKGKNILQYVHRIPIDPNTFNNIKVIVNPRLLFEVTVHGVLKPNGATVRVDSQIARLYHMRDNYKGDFSRNSMIEDTRVRDYADKLIPAVSKVLGETLKIDPNSPWDLLLKFWQFLKGTYYAKLTLVIIGLWAIRNNKITPALFFTSKGTETVKFHPSHANTACLTHVKK